MRPAKTKNAPGTARSETPYLITFHPTPTTHPHQPPLSRTFYTGVNLQLWFDGWSTSSPLPYTLALLGLAALGAANEGVAALRTAAAGRGGCCKCGASRANDAAEPLLAQPRPCCAAAAVATWTARAWRVAASPAGAAVTYAVHATVSYLLMVRRESVCNGWKRVSCAF